MFSPHKVRADFSRSAGSYDVHAALQREVLGHLLDYAGPLPKDALVLDAGCGTGALARATSHPSIIGIDSAASMCQQAQGAQWHTLNADMAALPFRDGSFNRVFSSLALQWAADWQIALREWKRVTSSGGMLTFSTFASGTLRELERSFAEVDEYPHISDFIVPEDVLQALPEAEYTSYTVEEYYPTLRDLALRLKGLGARNKHVQARRGLMTPRQFARAEEYYRKYYATPRGLRASWQVLLVKVGRV